MGLGVLNLFFFNDTATTEIYTLSLHVALPISRAACCSTHPSGSWYAASRCVSRSSLGRSEEHTSELQSQSNLVCRLLLEKKNNQDTLTIICDSRRGTSDNTPCQHDLQ